MPRKKQRKPFKFRVSTYVEEQLRDTIVATAEKNNRSLAGQLEYDLKQIYVANANS